MGAGSFKADVQGTYHSCMLCDDMTVGGAATTAWALVNVLPPACVWFLFINPGYHVKNDIMSMSVGVLGGMIGLVPTLVTFVAFIVPGLLAAGVGALVGLARKIRQ